MTRRLALLLSLALTLPALAENHPAHGWLSWRGPTQMGVSAETNLPDKVSPDKVGEGNLLWTHDLPGRGAPVIARYSDGDRLFTMGYRGNGPDLLEVIVCINPETGQVIWEHGYPDFLSDIVYNRYSIGSPSVDAETGNVYCLTSPGIALAFDRDGKELWRHSMLEEYGRLTFPNGRTGSPAIEGNLVIINAITSNWGKEGQARNRFYAFDKITGELVWSSDPGVGPPFLKDSSFAMSIFEWRGGKRVFYSGLGDGNIVCVNALNGQPIWRYQFAVGGVDSSVVLHGDKLIAIHGKENVDDSGRGRMVAIKLTDIPETGVLTAEQELWRNDGVAMFTSSPTLVGDRVYQVTNNGELACIDANTGKTFWLQKLGPDQLHASPLYADGKLYIPMWNGSFYIIRPSDAGAEILCHVNLGGQPNGSPTVFAGKIYVHTTEKIFCFGKAGSEAQTVTTSTLAPTAAAPAALMAQPAEVLMRPGDSVAIKVRSVDAAGLPVAPVQGAAWESFIPPTARVRSKLDAKFNDQGVLVAEKDAKYSAGSFQVKQDKINGTIRGRILPTPPYQENFDAFELVETNAEKAKFAYPPLPWIGARLKWEIQDLEGNKVLAKTLDNVLFQRSMIFLGHPGDANYTVEADVMTDGNRRMMSIVGVINQRYIIALDGMKQQVEVSSNYDRIQVGAAFTIAPKTWYRLKSRVDVAADGKGVVRGKAWPRGQAEPDAWTIEVPLAHPHTHGAPGLFGFSPQSRYRVFIDNVSVTPNS